MIAVRSVFTLLPRQLQLCTSEKEWQPRQCINPLVGALRQPALSITSLKWDLNLQTSDTQARVPTIKCGCLLRQEVTLLNREASLDFPCTSEVHRLTTDRNLPLFSFLFLNLSIFPRFRFHSRQQPTGTSAKCLSLMMRGSRFVNDERQPASQ